MDDVKPVPTAPLGVFAAGTWTYCGQACRESELDAAAYVAYRPFLDDRDRLLSERERLTRERDEALALLREIRDTSALTGPALTGPIGDKLYALLARREG